MTEENCIRTTRADCTNQSIFRIFEYKEELLYKTIHFGCYRQKTQRLCSFAYGAW